MLVGGTANVGFLGTKGDTPSSNDELLEELHPGDLVFFGIFFKVATPAAIVVVTFVLGAALAVVIFVLGAVLVVVIFVLEAALVVVVGGLFIFFIFVLELLVLGELSS